MGPAIRSVWASGDFRTNRASGCAPPSSARLRCRPARIPKLEGIDVSRLRDRLQLPDPGEAAGPALGDARPYEVFIQLQRGKPHIHAGTVDAVDADMAMQFAREHYGRDQQCVHIW